MTVSKQKHNGGTMAAAVTGAVVGAGVAIAGAIALSNEKNQERLKGAYDDVKNKVENFGKDVDEKVVEGKSKAAKTEKKIINTKDEIKDIWQK